MFDKKIILFLMTEKGFEVLQSLCSESQLGKIAFVVGARDTNVIKDYYDEIASLCEVNCINFFDRGDTFSVDDATCIAISWRWLIKDTSQLIVLHDSLLPRYRGFSPLVNMLLNREPIIGVTALYATADFDRGPIISSRKVAISYPIKIQDAITLISSLYSNLILEIFQVIGEIPSTPQDESLASYSLWRDEVDYAIDWTASADDIAHFISCVGFPFKGAYTFNGSERLRVLESEIYTDVHIENRQVGKVLFFEDGLPIVVCGKGLLKLTSIKNEDYQNKIITKFRTRFI